MLSIIVPMLNEERSIATTLSALRTGAPRAEIIVVDGGSTDTSIAVAQSLADKVITSVGGRSRQMNAGAAVASGDAFCPIPKSWEDASM
jgi:uncharacterized protein